MRRLRPNVRMVYKGMKLYRTSDTAHIFFKEESLHITADSMNKSRRLHYTKIKEPEEI